MSRIIANTCIKCGMCKEECPINAISEENTQYIIDNNKCLDCGACESICPTGSISKS